MLLYIHVHKFPYHQWQCHEKNYEHFLFQIPITQVYISSLVTDKSMAYFSLSFSLYIKELGNFMISNSEYISVSIFFMDYFLTYIHISMASW